MAQRLMDKLQDISKVFFKFLMTLFILSCTKTGTDLSLITDTDEIFIKVVEHKLPILSDRICYFATKRDSNVIIESYEIDNDRCIIHGTTRKVKPWTVLINGDTLDIYDKVLT